MYRVCSIMDTVRVPPNKFSDDLKKTVLELVRQEYEGLMDEDLGVVVAAMGVDDVGEGKVIPGDGAAYHETNMKLLVYKPEVHEVVKGIISEVTEFGAFVKIGPIEGLIHVSQIMDDYINYDPKLPGFIGKETSKKLQTSDLVLARVVSVSLKGNIASSKIGLTMRQEGLGKEDWAKVDEKARKKKADAKAALTAPKEKKRRENA